MAPDHAFRVEATTKVFSSDLIRTRDRPRFPALRGLLLLCRNVLGIGLLSVLLFEFVGQTFLFEDKLYFVNDVDHRMEPFSEPDLNSDGIRSFREAEDFREEAVNIVYLGDSFVYGFKLEAQDAVPAQLEAIARRSHPELEINVANFGWVSSSPLLSRRLLQDIGHKYKPDVVILGLDMSDFEDDIKYRKLIERQGFYKLLKAVPLSVLALKKILRKVPMLHPLHQRLFEFPAERFFVTAHSMESMLPYYEEVRRNIEDIHRWSRDELGAEFLLLVYPRSYQYSAREAPRNWEARHYEVLGPHVHEPFRYFEGLATKVEYPIYSLLEEFQGTDVFPTCFEWDPHWNEDGARIAARASYRACLQEGCFSVPADASSELPAETEKAR